MPNIQDLRDHLGSFYLAINPGYQWVRFQQLQIIPHLEAVERGEIDRLAIFMPPGSAKSDLSTRSFIPWYLGRHPTHNAMVCSYSADLASDDFGANIKARMEGALYRQIFPSSRLQRDSRSKTHFTNIAGGSFYSVGFAGGITGKRLNCFPAGTLVTTEHGPIEIEKLHAMDNPPMVLGFDHVDQVLLWRRIQATRKVESDALVEIITNRGRRIRCTRDHRIYTPNGYRPAALLQPGDRLYVAVHDVRRTGLEKEPVLQDVLPSGAPSQHARGFDLRFLRSAVQKIARGIREATAPWASLFLLQSSSRDFALLDEISKPVPPLREAGAHGSGLLLASMSARGLPAHANPDDLRIVQDRILPEQFAKAVLQPAVRQPGACGEDEGPEQSALQERNELREAVSRDENFDLRAGSKSLRCLRRSFADHLSPYRREPAQQSAHESDYALQLPSHYAPQIESDTVALVRDLRRGRIPVYDLQVEETNNFFANGILVHNCMVLDDLIKNKSEAESDATQTELFDIYKSTVKDRMRPGGKIIMCMHRWTRNDIAGRILEMDGTVDEGGAWTVLKLPAEDPPDSGNFLWEEYYGKKYYEDFKKDDETWSSKFQQDPGASLSYKFREEWLQFYDIAPPVGRFKAYIFVDPAAGKNRASDFTVINVFCPGQSEKLILVDWVWDRLDPGERMDKILALCRRWKPEALYYESYGLNADNYYIRERMREENFPQTAYPHVVGKAGPGHNNTKEARIDGLIPFYRQGKIVLPRKFERKRYDGTIVDYTKAFIDKEYIPYRGKKSIRFDDNLDCQSRIADPQVHINYDIPQEKKNRDHENSQPVGTSWYGIY